MANFKMLWKNLSDAAALSGGSWQIPVSKLQNKDIVDVARSTNLALSSTTFTLDQGALYQKTNGLLLASTNFTSSALVQVQVSNDAGFGTVAYDSTLLNVFGSSLLTGETDWDGGSWWFGYASDADLVGYPRNYFLEFPTQSARYITVIISDSSNPAGYLDIGRLIVGQVFKPFFNYKYSCKQKWVDTSVKSRGLAARAFSDVRPKYRWSTFSFDLLSNSEMYTQVLEIERQIGITGQVFIVPDDSDKTNFYRTSFLAQMAELQGIERLAHEQNGTTYTFEEIL